MTAPRPEQVVVLAGGIGSRLGQESRDRPKVLQDIGGRAFLELLLEPAAASGLRRFHFCLGHLGDQVAGHLNRLAARPGPAAGWEITTETEPVRMGTAGALLHSAHRLDDSFLLLLGDTYLPVDYGPLFGLFPPDALGMMVLTRAPGEVPPNVALHGTTVTGYDPCGIPGGWTDTGVTLLRRRALDLLDRIPRPGTAGPVDLAVLYRRLIDHRALAATTIGERFFDIGTPERRQALITELGTRRAAGPWNIPATEGAAG
jgi:NDP-sugar pyrophosphorylase family protein